MQAAPTLVENVLRLPRDWSLTLPAPLQHTISEHDMVLSRPGLRVWLSVWGDDGSGPARVARVRRDISGDAFGLEHQEDGAVCRLAYRIAERRGERSVQALHGFVFGPQGEVHLAMYCETPAAIELARRIWLGVVPLGSTPCG